MDTQIQTTEKITSNLSFSQGHSKVQLKDSISVLETQKRKYHSEIELPVYELDNTINREKKISHDSPKVSPKGTTFRNIQGVPEHSELLPIPDNYENVTKFRNNSSHQQKFNLLPTPTKEKWNNNFLETPSSLYKGSLLVSTSAEHSASTSPRGTTTTDIPRISATLWGNVTPRGQVNLKGTARHSSVRLGGGGVRLRDGTESVPNSNCEITYSENSENPYSGIYFSGNNQAGLSPTSPRTGKTSPETSPRVPSPGLKTTKEGKLKKINSLPNLPRNVISRPGEVGGGEGQPPSPTSPPGPIHLIATANSPKSIFQAFSGKGKSGNSGNLGNTGKTGKSGNLRKSGTTSGKSGNFGNSGNIRNTESSRNSKFRLPLLQTTDGNFKSQQKKSTRENTDKSFQNHNHYTSEIWTKKEKGPESNLESENGLQNQANIILYPSLDNELELYLQELEQKQLSDESCRGLSSTSLVMDTSDDFFLEADLTEMDGVL